jgi:uncharacterized protein YyaL (SSP411 family)
MGTIAKVTFVVIFILSLFLSLWTVILVVNGDDMENKPNRLVHEKSPYLLQHAYNPVDWYPWGDKAFEKARKENKPIFLSIGYSTCHWCHVMERESFEDQEVAELMNETFVSIKVDREERPDLDHIYMTVCQILTRSGGWPLNIIMTPDKKPFYAATYLPKKSRLGRIGMVDLVPRIKEVWETRHNEALDSADKIVEALHTIETESLGKELDTATLDTAYQELAQRFDQERGGFSNAPKFPTPHNFLFLLRYWKRTGNQTALGMVEKTLQEMRKGGIYDQIGFGFHRYSTDGEWLVPHFEKMLYDQALLAMANVEAHQATGKEEYKRTAQEIFTYVLRDMTSPAGGFYSAEDADSEGEEGKFYVWTEEEIRKILQKEDAEAIIKLLNVEKQGNFKEEATGRMGGANILHLKKPLPETASELKISDQDLQERFDSAREKLFGIREKRPHPLKDDKILTDWNGLMIAALAKGSKAFGYSGYAEKAQQAVDFILDRMRTEDGRLLHRYRDGQASIAANADDYAFFVWGLVELYEATFDARYLKTALQLNEDMLRHFWDEKVGGFFFTPDDGEELIVRKKEINDAAIPSGNSVAMLNLLRLSRFTGRPDLEEKASKLERAFSDTAKQLPSGYTKLMTSLDFGLGPSYEVVIVGNSDAKDTKDMIGALRSRFIPNMVVLFRPSEEKSPEIVSIAGFIENHVGTNGKATAYVCLNNACKVPTTDIKAMLAQIK